MRNQWTKHKLQALYDTIKTKGLTFKEAAKITGFSDGSCRSQWSRIDWDVFLENPDGLQSTPRKWSKQDCLLLYGLRKDAKLEYVEIGRRMGRSPISCERKFQTTNWQEIIGEKQYLKQDTIQMQLVADKEEEQERQELEEDTKKLTMYLIELSRHDPARLDMITQSSFLAKIKRTKKDLPCSFDELVLKAKHEFKMMGLDYPEEITLGEGTYIVVGDSHGKHTKRAVFSLLEQLNEYLHATNVIHIGHALDDDGDISFLWEKISNLLILAKQEELKSLAQMPFDYQVIRNEVHLGKLSVANQDVVQDYTPMFVGSISTQFFPDSVIVNCHRHEMDSRTTSQGHCLIGSPGCLCEPHIVKTVKQIDFWSAKQVRVSYPDSYIKYRRMRHTCKLWEQGIFIVHVNKDGEWDIIPSRILLTSKGYAASYFNKIITSNGVYDPSEKIMFAADAHCNWHDPNVLDIEEQFAFDYKPDKFVDTGDMSMNVAFNHHKMKRGDAVVMTQQENGPTVADALKENAHTHFILRRRNTWAKKQHLLLGNHERFPIDLVERFPQFEALFDNQRMLDTKSLGIEVTDLLTPLRFPCVTFVHGDMKMFGAKGTLKIEKVAQTFGRNSIIGHVHYPSMRFGCYSVGLTGLMDQDYNEPNASRWMHGFGFCNVFDNKVFISLVSIQSARCAINGKTYTPKSPSSWDLPDFKATMKFEFD